MATVFFVIKQIAALVAAGFLAGAALSLLFALYDRLPAQAAQALKILTVGPPLLLVLIGLPASLVLMPGIFIWYMLAGLLAESGRHLVFSCADPSFIKKLTGTGLMGAAAAPFMIGGLFVAAFTFTIPYSFKIKNYSGHEIVLKEVRVGRKTIFAGERKLAARPEGSARSSRDWSTGLSWDFFRKPGKITLILYDAKLGQEVRGEVRLPDSPKHGPDGCPFDIVYGPDGFEYEDNPCG